MSNYKIDKPYLNLKFISENSIGTEGAVILGKCISKLLNLNSLNLCFRYIFSFLEYIKFNFLCNWKIDCKNILNINLTSIYLLVKIQISISGKYIHWINLIDFLKNNFLK